MKFDANDPRLTSYVLGELDEAERALVEAQLEACPESRRAVEEIRATAELLTAELKQEACPALTAPQRASILAPPAPARRRFVVRHWKPLTAAASLILVAGTWAALRARQPEEPLVVAKLERGVETMALPDVPALQNKVWESLAQQGTTPGEKTDRLHREQEGIFWGGEDKQRTPLTGWQQRAQLERANERLDVDGDPGFAMTGRGRAGGGPFRGRAPVPADQGGQATSDNSPAVSGIGPEPKGHGKMVEFERSLSLIINQTQRVEGEEKAVGDVVSPIVGGRQLDRDQNEVFFGEGTKTVPASPAEAAGTGGGVTSDFDPRLIELIENIEVDSWDPQGPGAMDEFETTLGLVINQTQSLPQQQVAAIRGAKSPRELLQRVREIDAATRCCDVDHNTEAYARIVDNPFLAVGDNPLSTFSIDVDTASYANVRRFLNQGALPPPDAVRIEELVNYFTYEYPAPEGDAPFSSHVEVAGCPWTPEHRLVRVALKGREISEENRPAANLVFLLDVSGSMQPENKLPLVKKAMRLLVERLTENDRVGLVVYAGSSGVALPSTTANNQETILAAIETLSAGGSTNGASGIEQAYDMAVSHFIKDGTNRVILCTDGDFNVGITDQGQLHRLIEEKAKSGVFLSVLGFGMDNLKDSTLEILADKGNGNYGYIDTLNEARKVLVEEMGGTLVTIAKDVKIQVEFNPNEVAAYRLIGYENRVLAAEDFNDDKKDAGEIGAGHAVTALYEIVPAGKEVDLPSVDNLKYQKRDELAEAAFEGELLELKLRYKEPDGEVSKLLKFPVKDDGKDFGRASDDFKFAAAVAAFGMLLRGSPYKGNATLAAVSEIAEDGKGHDRHGYRAEFLELVTKAKAMSVRELTAEDAEK